MKLYYVEHPDCKQPENLVVFAYIARDIDHLGSLMTKKFSTWHVISAGAGYELNKDWSAFYGT